MYEVGTQVLYNRVIIQIGLCAFRMGFIAEAHSSLVDMCTYGRLKELLA